MTISRVDFVRYKLISKETIFAIIVGILFSGFAVIPITQILTQFAEGERINVVILIGYIFILISPLIFIILTPLFHIFTIFPRAMVFLSNKNLHFFNSIPGFSIKGQWFVEKHGEQKEIKSTLDILNFIVNRWHSLFFVNLGIYAILIQVINSLGYFDIFKLTEPIHSIEALIILTLAPIINGLYFSWIWLWDDIELKVNKKDKDGNLKIWMASNTPANLMSLIVGVGSILWMASGNVDVGLPAISPFTDIIINILLLMVLFSGPSILFGIFLYRSEAYEKVANSLKYEIISKYYQQVPFTSEQICDVCNGSGKLPFDTIPASITIAKPELIYDYSLEES